MSCANRVVLNEGRLKLDDCALAETERQNHRIDTYWHFNPVFEYEHMKNEYQQVAECNQFVPFNGRGSTHPELVDIDSQLKVGQEITSNRVINQEFRKRGANGELEDQRKLQENRMKRGNDYGLRRCDVLSEVTTLDLQYTPMIECLEKNIQDPINRVVPWTWGGDSTRDTLYQRAFLEQQGHTFIDGIAVDSGGFQRREPSQKM